MTVGAAVVLALMVAACALLVYGANWAERRWRSMHPPDDWDGTREDTDDE